MLVEVGHRGGRAGCRTVESALSVARLAATVDRLRLAGVAGYEGGLPGTVAVRAYLATLREAARAVAPLVTGGPAVVSAGGSAYPDVVAEQLAGPRWEVVLRSGAYAVHDDGFYAARSPLSGLAPALRLWAQVLSTPEEGLAIVGAGRRDVSFDQGLPVPLEIRDGAGRDPRPTGRAIVTALDDQHAYLAARGTPVRPGDLICFGVSHPCTTLDKWRVVPVVDDERPGGRPGAYPLLSGRLARCAPVRPRRRRPGRPTPPRHAPPL